MTDPLPQPAARLRDLLADRAVFGLTFEEEAELKVFLAAHPIGEDDAFDLLAADIARSGLPENLEPLPEPVANRVRAAAGTYLLGSPAPSPRSRVRILAAGGFAIAASALIAFGLYHFNGPRRALTDADRREALLARVGQPGSDVIRAGWTATTDPAAKGASGELVWSTAGQEGYMLFRGLAANAPDREQYQLWVFDADRPGPPVDGGVFDVPPGAADVVVPIRVKLGVSQPTLFAVTVERPGGVVVSNQKRITLKAAVPRT